MHANGREEWNLLSIVWQWLKNEDWAGASDHKNPIWRDEHGKHIDLVCHDDDDVQHHTDSYSDYSDSDDRNDDKHIEKRKDSGEQGDDYDDDVITNVTSVNDPVAYEDLRVSSSSSSSSSSSDGED